MLWLSLTTAKTLRRLLVRRPAGSHSLPGDSPAEEKILTVTGLEDRLPSDSHALYWTSDLVTQARLKCLNTVYCAICL